MNMIKYSLKIIISASILVWMFRSGKIDFSSIGDIFQSAWLVISLIILSFTHSIIGTFRLKTILKGEGLEIPFLPLFKVQYIGIFFSSFLPGSVSGDFVKAYYLQSYIKGKTYDLLLFSLLNDRLIGFYSLISSSLISGFILNTFTEIAIPKGFILVTLVLVSLSSISSLILIFFSGRIITALRNLQHRYSSNLIKKIIIILMTILRFFTKPKSVILAFLFGCLGHMIIAIQFITVNIPTLGVSKDLFKLIPFFPIGILSSSIPLSLNGAGITHMAFEELLKNINITNGAQLFNNFFVVSLIYSLIGVVPFLFHNSRIKKANQ